MERFRLYRTKLTSRADFGVAATIYSLALILSGGLAGKALAQSSNVATAQATASLTMTGFPLQADSQTDIDLDKAIALTRLVQALTPGGVLGLTYSTARAEIGDLGVLAHAEVEGSDNPRGGSGTAIGRATAIYKDRIVVSSPSLREGDFIDLEADIIVPGKLRSSAMMNPPYSIGPILSPGDDASAQGSLSMLATNTPGLIRLEGDALGLSDGSVSVCQSWNYEVTVADSQFASISGRAFNDAVYGTDGVVVVVLLPSPLVPNARNRTT